MLYVDNKGITDPLVNLAIEEHLLRNLAIDEPILLFYMSFDAKTANQRVQILRFL